MTKIEHKFHRGIAIEGLYMSAQRDCFLKQHVDRTTVHANRLENDEIIVGNVINNLKNQLDLESESPDTPKNSFIIKKVNLSKANLKLK